MAPDTIIRNGNNYTFTFKLTAPAAGSYYTQYRMMWSNHYVFGQIAGHTINVKSNTPPAPKITATPTPKPYMAYNAHGKMTLIQKNGIEYKGPIRYFYDEPLGNHFERSSAGASDYNYPYWEWDIGGPNGYYKIYNNVDQYYGRLQFEMNNGGNKGKVVFYQM